MRLTNKEEIQLHLSGLHRLIQQEDLLHRAQITQDVKRDWPQMEAWILEQQRLQGIGA